MACFVSGTWVKLRRSGLLIYILRFFGGIWRYTPSIFWHMDGICFLLELSDITLHV